MWDFIRQLFSSEEFMPHGHCFLWYPEILWMHVVSDIIITIAYFSIPMVLLYVLRKRRNVPFKWVIAMFALFILLCGTSHVVNVWTLWDPVYRFEGVIKALTAAVSIATALMILPLVPKFLDVAEEMQRKQDMMKGQDAP